MIDVQSLLQSRLDINRSLKESLIILAKLYNQFMHSFDNAIAHAMEEQNTSDSNVAKTDPIINAEKAKSTIETIYNMYETTSILIDDDSPILRALSPNILHDLEDLETQVSCALLICINTCRRLVEVYDKESLTMYIDYCEVLSRVNVILSGINSNIADLLSIEVVLKLIKELCQPQASFDWLSAAKDILKDVKK